MAIVWQQQTSAGHYEVRVAGNSKRLYKDGVFHSQWNIKRPLSNGVWDLLFLPALFREPPSIQRVLVLGVGGGAVINTFATLLNPQEIVGVELDPVHIKIAREYFLLPDVSAKIYQADAIEWIRDYRGDGFDIVVEDLFTENAGEPVKVVSAGKSWFRKLQKLLRPGGVLIVNFEDPEQMREAAPAYLDSLGSKPDIRYQFSQPSYGNSVCAFLDEPGSPVKLRSRLSRLLSEYPACSASGQKFRVRRVINRSAR